MILKLLTIYLLKLRIILTLLIISLIIIHVKDDDINTQNNMIIDIKDNTTTPNNIINYYLY